MSRRLIIAGAAAIAIIAAYIISSGATASRVKNITVEIRHGDGTSKTITITTNADYLRKTLEQVDGLIAGMETEYGLVLTTVDGYEAKGKYERWEYTLNGKTPNTGLDTVPINDGDAVVFTLSVG